MNIKKTNTGVGISSQTFSLEVTFENSRIKILTETLNGSQTIDAPGEFEYKSVGFVALEVTEELKVGTPNLVHIYTPEAVGVLVISEPMNISKEYLDSIPGTSILVMPLMDLVMVKQIVKQFQPDRAVFLSNKSVADVDYVQKLSKEYPKVFTDTAGKISIKDSELVDAEDLIQEFYIL